MKPCSAWKHSEPFHPAISRRRDSLAVSEHHEAAAKIRHELSERPWHDAFAGADFRGHRLRHRRAGRHHAPEQIEGAAQHRDGLYRGYPRYAAATSAVFLLFPAAGYSSGAQAFQIRLHHRRAGHQLRRVHVRGLPFGHSVHRPRPDRGGAFAGSLLPPDDDAHCSAPGSSKTCSRPCATSSSR